jgi:hypothetical protein
MPYQASSTRADVSSPIQKHRQQEKPQYSLVNSLLQLSKSEVCYHVPLDMVLNQQL